MRPLASRKSGAVQTRTLAVVILLLVLSGIVVFLLNRPPTKPGRVEIPATPVEQSRTNLVLEEGRLRQPGAATPFSGYMVEHHASGTLRSRSAVTNGVLNGLSEGWYTNAQIQVAEHFKEGVSHGLRTKWHTNGVKQSEANIIDGKLHGSFRKWHDNGTISEQAEFVAGEPEGPSVAYYPSGFLKARVTMRDGKPTEQSFWNDGEKKE